MRAASRGRRAGGFTLLELALVLFVLGLVVGGALGPLAARVEAEQRRRAEAELDRAGEALYGFALSRGRLPCPDCRARADCPGLTEAERNDGLEDLEAGRCASLEGERAQGNLPWATLGTAPGDPWGGPYGYAVTAALADEVDGDGCGEWPAPGVSFELCSNGNLTVEDRGDPARSRPLGSGLPALVWSHGRNAVFGRDAAGEPLLAPPLAPAERENADADGLWLANGYAGERFDDQLRWLSMPVLLHRLVTAGRLP